MLVLALLAAQSALAWSPVALKLQRGAARALALDAVPLLGTHNTFNWRDLTSVVYEVPHNQLVSVAEQVYTLGARWIELDPHFIAELADRDEADRVRLCHMQSSTAALLRAACANDWAACNADGIYDYGIHTGCNPDAPRLSEELALLAAWASAPEHAGEVLLLYLNEVTEGRADLMTALLTEHLGEHLFTPGDAAGALWPSVEDLTEQGTRARIVAFSSTTSSSDRSELVFSRADHVDQVKPDEYVCAADAFTFVQGDGTQVIYDGVTLHDGPEGGANFVSADEIGTIVDCGLSVALDLFDAPMRDAFVYSFAAGEDLAVGAGACARMRPSDGRWLAGACDDGAYPFACRSSTDSTAWVLADTADGCPGGHVHGVPRSRAENDALLAALTAGEAAGVWLDFSTDSDGCWASAETSPTCPTEADIPDLGGGGDDDDGGASGAPAAWALVLSLIALQL